MNLSKLTLDPRSRRVQVELANPYRMHCNLMSAFPADIKDKERVLYRLETSHVPPYLVLLVQSHLTPDWTGLEDSGYLLQPAQVKTFEPQFYAGQTLTFRLVANPTKRLKSTIEGELGKRIGLFRSEDQEQWLHRKADQSGFSILTVQLANLADQIAYKEINGKQIKVTNHGVRFDGVLNVLDTELFSQALLKGIGSAKGFGFGLLSLARA